MNKKKNLIFFLIFFLNLNCSFDNKTGIWSGSEQERSRILELEEKQNQTDSSFRKVYSSEDVYSKEISLNKNYHAPTSKSSWRTAHGLLLKRPIATRLTDKNNFQMSILQFD